MKQRFLFEIIPQYFPERFLTDTEILLWEIYYKQKEESLKK